MVDVGAENALFLLVIVRVLENRNSQFDIRKSRIAKACRSSFVVSQSPSSRNRQENAVQLFISTTLLEGDRLRAREGARARRYEEVVAATIRSVPLPADAAKGNRPERPRWRLPEPHSYAQSEYAPRK